MAHLSKSGFPSDLLVRTCSIVAVILLAAATARAQEWSCVQHDPQHTGRSPRLVHSWPPEEKWRANPGGSILGTPVIRADGSIVVANGHNKQVSAWDALGNSLWSYTANGGILGAPAVQADGKTLFGDLDGWMYRLNADGTLDTSIQNSSTPKTEKRIVCDMTPRPNGGYATGDWSHQLIFNTGGATNQQFPLAANVYPHAPVTFNNDGTRAFYATRPSANWTQILCVDPASNTLAWATSYSHIVGAKLTSQISGIAYDSTNSRLFFSANYHAATSNSCFLYSLSAINGAKNTNFPVSLGVGSYSTPALAPDGSAVYITTLDGRLLKINATTGATMWTYNSAALAIRGSAVVDRLGRVVFGDMSGFVHCLDANGNLLWKHDGGGVIASTPAVASDGEVVFATANGELTRLSPKPFVIPYAASKHPQLDGVLSLNEWQGAWKISVNGSSPWVNPGWDADGNTLTPTDASYDLYAMHDGEYLYVAFDANDETIMASQAPVKDTPPPATGGAADYIYNVWFDDCTEVYIDADRDGVNESMSDRPNWAEGIHIHYGVLGHCWASPDVAGAPNNGTFGTVWGTNWWGGNALRPGGYIHEYKFRMAGFDTENGPGFTGMKPGDIIGFNAMLNDDDVYSPADNSDRREDRLAWWGAEEPAYDTNKFPATWPPALLSPTPIEESGVKDWNRLR